MQQYGTVIGYISVHYYNCCVHISILLSYHELENYIYATGKNVIHLNELQRTLVLVKWICVIRLSKGLSSITRTIYYVFC